MHLHLAQVYLCPQHLTYSPDKFCSNPKYSTFVHAATRLFLVHSDTIPPTFSWKKAYPLFNIHIN